MLLTVKKSVSSARMPLHICLFLSRVIVFPLLLVQLSLLFLFFRVHFFPLSHLIDLKSNVLENPLALLLPVFVLAKDSIHHVLSSNALDDDVEAEVFGAEHVVAHILEELIDFGCFFIGVRVLDDH